MGEVLSWLSVILAGSLAGILVCACAYKAASWGQFSTWIETSGLSFNGQAQTIAFCIVLVEGGAVVALVLSTSNTIATLLTLCISLTLISGHFLLKRYVAEECPCLGSGKASNNKRVSVALGFISISSALQMMVLLSYPLVPLSQSPTIGIGAACAVFLLGAFLMGETRKKRSRKILTDSLLRAKEYENRERILVDLISSPAIYLFVATDCRGCKIMMEVLVGLEHLVPDAYTLITNIAGFESCDHTLGNRIQLAKQGDSFRKEFNIRAVPSIVLVEGSHFTVIEGLSECIAALGEVIASR